LLAAARRNESSNDVSEGNASGNVREWRAVALYFRNLFDKQHQSIGALRMSLAVEGLEKATLALQVKTRMNASDIGKKLALLDVSKAVNRPALTKLLNKLGRENRGIR
jgi:hypothetical protein